MTRYRKTICVFCGAKPGNDPKFLQAATATGVVIAKAGHRLAYGGGNVGLMGALADGALSAGGAVLGIIPHKLLERELAHKGISQIEVVADMATRKERMIAESDAFLSLPGGLGTLDELFEVLTLRQIGYHNKPSAILNLDGYFDHLLTALNGFVAAGLVDRKEVAQLLVANNVPQAIELLEAAILA